MLSITSYLKLVIYPTFMSNIPGLSIYIFFKENELIIHAGSIDNQNYTHNEVVLEMWEYNNQGFMKFISSVKNSQKITSHHHLFDMGNDEWKSKMFFMKAKNRQDIIDKIFPNIEDIRPLMKEISLIVDEYDKGIIDQHVVIERFGHLIKAQYEQDTQGKIDQIVIKAKPYKLCFEESSSFDKMRYFIRIFNRSINSKLVFFLNFLLNKF